MPQSDSTALPLPIAVAGETLDWQVEVQGAGGDTRVGLTRLGTLGAGVQLLADQLGVPAAEVPLGRRGLAALGRPDGDGRRTLVCPRIVEAPPAVALRGAPGAPVWVWFAPWPAGPRAPVPPPDARFVVVCPAPPFRLCPAVEAPHPARRIVVLEVEALREAGALVARGLSWESAVLDTVQALATHPALAGLRGAEVVVVRFGVSGALAWRAHGESRVVVVAAEIAAEAAGLVPGVEESFVAELARACVTELDPCALPVLSRALLAARRVHDAALVVAPDGALARGAPRHVGALVLTERVLPARLEEWSLVGSLGPKAARDAALAIVFDGPGAPAAAALPVVRFGKLVAIERREVEDLAEAQRQLQDYRARPHPERPLSLAVFGPPGAGKSFAVRQLAATVDAGGFEELTVNLTQLESPAQLIPFFHRVRDIGLAGRRLPLVFFDEFDAELAHIPLGWLASFLAPMQDGIFRADGVDHGIGPAVFVFAGGTSPSWKEFALRARTAPKGPDFLSRLRGTVDVASIGGADGPVTPSQLLRRAFLLRGILGHHAPAVVAGGRARIAEAVVLAMLHTQGWRHGARSMEAVIEMSVLTGHPGFGPSDLPSRDTLDLHVDAEAFLDLLRSTEVPDAVRKRLAAAAHARYLARQARPGAVPGAPTTQVAWSDLGPADQAANLALVDRQVETLRQLDRPYGAGLLPTPPLHLGADEIETLAEAEHAAWVERKRDGQGAKFGPEKGASTHPDLVPWSQLSPASQDKDRQIVADLDWVLTELLAATSEG